MRSLPEMPAASAPNDRPESPDGRPPLRRAFDHLTAMAVRLTDARGAVLVVPAGDSVTIKGATGLSPTEQGGFVAWAGPACPLLVGSDESACITPTDSPALSTINAGAKPIQQTDWMAFPAKSARPDGWLVLLDAHPADRNSNHAADTLALVLEQAQALLDLDKLESSPNALHESESRLNLTEHTAGVGSWAVVLSTGQVHISNECASILGVDDASKFDSMEAMVNCYTPEWRDGMQKRLSRCQQSGVPFDEEIQVMVEGVGPKWVRTVGAALRDAQGHIVRLQGAVQDISAQKQAQQETLRLAMRLTTTLASITEAFVTLDRECRFTYLNQESERLLQKSTADLLDKEIWDGFGPSLAERLRDQMHKALKNNRRIEMEDHFPSLGKWLEVRAYPFAEGLAVYFRDVTERRRSQEQLMLLETSVARLNDIVAIAETGINNNQEPRIVFVNDAFERHTGYSRDEVLGQTPHMLLELEPALPKLREMAMGLQMNRQARTELMVHRKNGAMFWVELEVVSVQATAEDVTHWVAVGRDITQRKTAEDMIRHMALYDPLTDLPNRQLLTERLQQALAQSERSGQHGALMFIDLDNFKILNDTLGHHVGDQLLKKVAIRLAQSVRKTDTVARLGGDEFVIMVDDLSTDPEAAALKSHALANKVLTMLREPFHVGGHQHFATPSIGVTAFTGLNDDVGELLKQADLAMYQAKTLGRNTLCFFDPAMQATVNANAALGVDMRVALKEQQFVVYYQPQVDRQGVITGVEALVRWQHPQRGLITPIHFIPVAEDNGMILPLGQWVLETACEQLAAWADWPQTTNLTIAVNVSVHQFRHPDFVDMVMAAIGRTGIKPQRLKLELTESLLADRMEITIEKMGMLKDLGVTLSLDDFGVGYSSLSVLKRLPLDQLKIDKGFVADVLTDPNDAAISRAIITLAQSLSLQVVAEGVETQEQREFLAYQGCDQFQGHLFSPPLPIATLDAFLRNPSSGMMVVSQ
ncbi:EAL domain-containing protein [Hydrogenophaga sp.]|uniref:sensor domain-containing protein n=1 Tax=Hydrogenophaga sp. TaxID=1904254 RepID=UPI00271CB5C4|nr:EAL domain-containing protein [Hydrogenophaga sp.]MDO8905725.1 EAL domain-containing protein [Hydrogenophaga sp.]